MKIIALVFGFLISIFHVTAAPHPARVLEKEVEGLVRGKKWSAALELVALTTKEFPGDWRIRYLHGVLFNQMGREKEALKVFLELQKATGDLPDLPVAAPPTPKKARHFYWSPEVNSLIRESDSFLREEGVYDGENAHPFHQEFPADLPLFTLPNSPIMAKRLSFIRAINLLRGECDREVRSRQLNEFLRNCTDGERWFYFATFDSFRFLEMSQSEPALALVYLPLARSNGLFEGPKVRQLVTRCYAACSEAERAKVLPFIYRLFPMSPYGKKDGELNSYFDREVIRLKAVPHEFRPFSQFVSRFVADERPSEVVAACNLGKDLMIELAKTQFGKPIGEEGSMHYLRITPTFPPEGPARRIIGVNFNHQIIKQDEFERRARERFEFLRDEVSKIEHRVLRAGIYKALGEEEKLKVLIQDFDRSSEYHELRAAACYHFMIGDFKKSFAIFVRLRKIAPGFEAQGEVDQYLNRVGDELLKLDDSTMDLTEYHAARKRFPPMTSVWTRRAELLRLNKDSQPEFYRYTRYFPRGGILPILIAKERFEDALVSKERSFSRAYERGRYHGKSPERFAPVIEEAGLRNILLDRLLEQKGMAVGERVFRAVILEPVMPGTVDQLVNDRVEAFKDRFEWLKEDDPALSLHRLLRNLHVLEVPNRRFDRSCSALLLIRYLEGFPVAKFRNHHARFLLLVAEIPESEAITRELLFFLLGMASEFPERLKDEFSEIFFLTHLDLETTERFLSQFPKELRPPGIERSIERVKSMRR